ncbi:MAG: hypothetical protein OXC63_10950 [Aestuariivita sp.]|nr:hypothetical protein [Aestuariivita sp.]MCY4347700.1 hypothetical protein [Aestuariivita sp.]
MSPSLFLRPITERIDQFPKGFFPTRKINLFASIAIYKVLLTGSSCNLGPKAEVKIIDHRTALPA